MDGQKLFKELFDAGKLSISISGDYKNKGIYNLKDKHYDRCDLDVEYNGFPCHLLLSRNNQEDKGYLAINFRGQGRSVNAKWPSELRCIDIIVNDSFSLRKYFSDGIIHNSYDNVCLEGNWKLTAVERKEPLRTKEYLSEPELTPTLSDSIISSFENKIIDLFKKDAKERTIDWNVYASQRIKTAKTPKAFFHIEKNKRIINVWIQETELGQLNALMTSSTHKYIRDTFSEEKLVQEMDNWITQYS